MATAEPANQIEDKPSELSEQQSVVKMSQLKTKKAQIQPNTTNVNSKGQLFGLSSTKGMARPRE